MSIQLEIITDEDRAHVAINEIQLAQSNELVLLELPGGVLNFAAIAFQGARLDQIYAKKVMRDAEGSGPHFDLHSEYLHDDFAYLGVYNLSGDADISTAQLDDSLYEAYVAKYPNFSDAAYTARRHVGFTALLLAGEQRREGTISVGTGFILPQHNSQPPLVHEIKPKNIALPGEFVKLIVLKSEESQNAVRTLDEGYVSFDEFITHSIPSTPVNPDTPFSSSPAGRRKSSIARSGGRLD